MISLLSAATRIACRQMTPEHLNALHASVERASCLSARHDWERKATAHAELFTMLSDVTGDRDLSRLVSSAARRLQDLFMTVGRGRRHDPELAPQAAARAASLGRRRCGLGSGAPPQGPALHGAPGLRSRFQHD